MANLWELFKYHTARTGEQRWNADRWCNADALKHHERTLRWATRLGMAGLADRAQAEITEGQFMAERAEQCPNNPANGGQGYDTGDGRWVDRRGPEWVSVEDRFAGTDVLDRVDGIRDYAGEEPGWFGRRRAARELSDAFGQLDTFEDERKSADIEATDEYQRAVAGEWDRLLARIDRLVAIAPPRALAEYLDFGDDVDHRSNAEYAALWEEIKADIRADALQEQSTWIDPLTRDDVDAVIQEPEAGQELASEVAADELAAVDETDTDPPADEPGTGEAHPWPWRTAAQQLEALADRQHLGYVDGELVCDLRSGVTGRVRVRDDEETGRYAEVQWDGSFVADELELAIDNGLERELEATDGVATAAEPPTADSELIAAARDWISECGWSDLTLEQVAELSDDEVLRGIEQHYDGGLPMFEAAERFPAGNRSVSPVAPVLEINDAELVAEPTPLAPGLDLAEPEPATGTPDDAPNQASPVTAPELAGASWEGIFTDTAALETTGLAADEQQLSPPPAEQQLEEPGLDGPGDDDEPGGGVAPVESAVELEQATETTIPEPELEPEPAAVVEPSSWWRTTTDRARGKIRDKVQFAKDWIKELRSGRHRQCHGAWETTDEWGRTLECTIRVAENTFGVTREDISEAYGHRFVDGVLERNDVLHQSFDQTAAFIDKTQLKGREIELER